MSTGARRSRRAVLRGLVALALTSAAGPLAAHGLLGPVTPPLSLPDIGLTLHDGRRTRLSALLSGRVCALQLMFTGCSSICPIQGAVFADVQRQLVAAGRPGRRDAVSFGLVSISIDALGDDARALAAWRQRHGADRDWLAAVPSVDDIDRLIEVLRGRATGVDRHTAQVFITDRAGRLAYRCAELAAASAVVQALRGVAGSA
jgi:protein SCO1/2